MSNTDSFIDEVTEEVRRDRLFGYLRRYGWIAILCVLALVGGTAFNEWRKAQAAAEAETAGDAILAALEIDDEGARAAGLQALEAGPGAEAIAGLLAAADLQAAGDMDGAVAALEAITVNGDVPQAYRDLAAMKAAIASAETADPDALRARLELLAMPGATYRPLALEQLALLEAREGNSEAAIEQMRALAQEAGITRGLRNRALAMIVALGGDVADLVDPNGAVQQGELSE